MRIKAKTYGIYAGLLLGLITTASATTLLTFQVDMSNATTNLFTFDPNTQTVAARGSFNGWGNSPDVPLALTNNPTGPDPYLWSGTISVPLNGVVMSYKYTIEPDGTYEAVRSGGGHNRLITLPSASGSSLTLPRVAYGDAPFADITVPVTLQVDLAQQINTGAFDTNTSSAYARGFFNNYSADPSSLMTNDPSILRTNGNGLVTSNVYVVTFDVVGSPGETIDYKYFIDTGNNWESPTPGTGDPADNNNRFFNLSGGSAQTLPVIFFNDSPYSPVATNDVTFQVDLTGKIINGEFDPTIGTVELRGSFNGWGTPQIFCTNNPAAANTNIYSVVIPLADGVGAIKQYKFWASITTNGGWETLADNRTMQIVSGTAQALPTVYFDNVVPNAGTITLTPLGTDLELDWFGHPGIRVQISTSVSGGWVDDLNTDGQSSAVYPIEAGPKYYRLRYQP